MAEPSPALPVLTRLLGPRQAEIMQRLWRHGPATVRELHVWLTRAEPLAYTSVMTTCVRLWEKGLLDRRQVTETDAAQRHGKAFVYTPRLSEAEFLEMATTPASDPPYLELAGIPHHDSHDTEHPAIETLLEYLGTLHDGTGQPLARQAVETISALLERAEAAERAVLIYQAEAIRALQRAASAERRALAAEDGLSAISAVDAPPRVVRATTVPSSAVYEFPGREKICRICGRLAPPPSARRHDDLRVRALPSCRQEARRRDNVAKQLRAVARKHMHRTTADSAAAEGISA
jgi:predicted transcriptional regulator